MKCRNCRHLYKDWCVHKLDSPDPDLDRECKDYMQATRSDRIRAMSDKELATMLFDYKECNKNCIMNSGKHCYEICEEESCILKWLQQPAEEDT